METNINYTVVGAFVITLLASIIFAIIWLSSGFSLEHYTKYLVNMQESVSGLNPDSAVEFNGVNVGEVESINIDHSNPHSVAVLLSVKSDTPVTRGTVATLATRGLTGLVYIALKDKGIDRRPLVALKNQHYPVIPTAPSLFVRIDAALTRLTTNLETITTSIQSVLDPQNVRSIKATLLNVERITGTLAANRKQIDAILNSTAHGMQSGANSIQMLQTQALPATYRLLNNLDEITRELSEVSAELKQNPSILIRGIAKPPLGPGETR